MNWKIGDEVSVEFIGKIVGMKKGVRDEIFYDIKNELTYELPETAQVRGSRLYPLPNPEDFKADQDHKYEQARVE